MVNKLVRGLVGGLFLLAMSAGVARPVRAAEDGEFSDKRKYDATQCIAMQEQERVIGGERLYSVYAENRCSRPVRGLACFEVIEPASRFPRAGWYCQFAEYKARSRRKVADRARYGRVKKWAACNEQSSDCIRRLKATESGVERSGQDPEKVARTVR